jgi:hypothetical protein
LTILSSPNKIQVDLREESLAKHVPVPVPDSPFLQGMLHKFKQKKTSRPYRRPLLGNKYTIPPTPPMTTSPSKSSAVPTSPSKANMMLSKAVVAMEREAAIKFSTTKLTAYNEVST